MTRARNSRSGEELGQTARGGQAAGADRGETGGLAPSPFTPTPTLTPSLTRTLILTLTRTLFSTPRSRDEEWVSVYELAEACMKRGMKEFMADTAPVAK